MLVWFYGGGVQTARIATLVVQGYLPRPDMVVMADTGREATETWTYLDTVMRPYLATVGMEVVVVPHTYATVDLYAGNGDLLIPAYTANGKLPSYCSNEWKRRPCLRYLREQGVKSCTAWLGMSSNEIRRMADSPEKWITHQYPLIELVPQNRIDCLLGVQAAGLARSPRSSCEICPHRSDEEWQWLRDTDPDGWARAIALDTEIRARDQQGGVWLHKSRLPLAEAPLDTDQLDLFPIEECRNSCYT